MPSGEAHSRIRPIRCVGFLLILIGLLTGTPARAEPPQSVLRVATRIVPPLVVKDHGHLSGFSIDLWNALANELGVKSEYVETGDVTSLLDLVKQQRRPRHRRDFDHV